MFTFILGAIIGIAVTAIAAAIIVVRAFAPRW